MLKEIASDIERGRPSGIATIKITTAIMAI